VSKWRLGQSWDGCEWLHSSVVLNKGVCCKFPFILVNSKTVSPITWPDAYTHCTQIVSAKSLDLQVFRDVQKNYY